MSGEFDGILNDPSYHKTICRKDLVPDHKRCTGICQQCLSLRHSTRLPRVPSGHKRNLCRQQSSPGPGRSSCRWRLPPGSRSYPPPPPLARQTAGSASSGAECFPPLQMRKMLTHSNIPERFLSSKFSLKEYHSQAERRDLAFITWAMTRTIARPASAIKSPRRRSCLRKKAGKGMMVRQYSGHLCKQRRN